MFSKEFRDQQIEKLNTTLQDSILPNMKIFDEENKVIVNSLTNMVSMYRDCNCWLDMYDNGEPEKLLLEMQEKLFQAILDKTQELNP